METGLNMVVRKISRIPKWKRIGVFILLSFVLFKIGLWVVPLPRAALFRPTSTLVFAKKERLLRAFTARDEAWRIQTSLSKISPYIRKFQIVYEDRWFYWHSGLLAKY